MLTWNAHRVDWNEETNAHLWSQDCRCRWEKANIEILEFLYTFVCLWKLIRGNVRVAVPFRFPARCRQSLPSLDWIKNEIDMSLTTDSPLGLSAWVLKCLQRLLSWQIISSDLPVCTLDEHECHQAVRDEERFLYVPHSQCANSINSLSHLLLNLCIFLIRSGLPSSMTWERRKVVLICCVTGMLRPGVCEAIKFSIQHLAQWTIGEHQIRTCFCLIHYGN